MLDPLTGIRGCKGLAAKYSIPAWCCRFSVVGLVVLLTVLTGGATGLGAATQSVSVSRPGTFALGDFDGDQRVDLAKIQFGSADQVAGNYWIEVQLSGSGLQLIRVTGPPGGLSIEARDVDGDQDVDLVVTTAWFRRPVAILLNDGRGGFSRAAPDAFAGAFIQQRADWSSAPTSQGEVLGAPASCSRFGISKEHRAHARNPRVLALLQSWQVRPFAHHILSARPSRAPPLA